MRPVLRRRCNFQGCGTQGHRSPSNSLWSNSFWGPDFFLGCLILRGLQFHGFQSLKGKWAIPSTLVLLSPGTSTLVRYYYHQHKWWCSFLKQVHLTKKMQKRCIRIAQSTHKPKYAQTNVCKVFLRDSNFTYEESSASSLSTHSTSFTHSFKSFTFNTLFLESLTLNYTYSQNWTPCSSRYLWPRVGGAKGDVPEVGGGGQRRPDHPDQVARHHRHQRLPQRWQLQGEQEAVRDGSVGGRRHLRTNQVFIAHNYWSSVACQMCF